jgi:elongation factor P
MASSSDIKNGLCMEYNNDIFQVIEFMHVKPGKGAAFVRTKLKSLTNGKVLDNTFPSGHKITEVRVERRKFQYLYKDDMGYHFMNNETYEQVALQEDLLPNANLLKEAMHIDVLYHADKEIPLTVDMPQYIELEITYTEPGIKGDTATNASKPATVETGAEIRVPLFINQGDVVKIESATSNYVERVKK